MKFGLVGTGPWAQITHGPGLLRAPEVDLAGVWGRSTDKARSLAEQLDVRAYEDLDDLLEAVDAVAFAVPPDIQVELALQAARAGKHLLLDKPVATSSDAARELADEAAAHGCAAIVLFTDRFLDGGAAWLAEVSGQEWQGASMVWLGALDSPDSPYRESQWRRERGALWDIGPHALSTLIGALGPVTDIRAVAGRGDVAHLVTTHASGASATATMSLFAPSAAAGRHAMLWGEPGVSTMPQRDGEAAAEAVARAATALRESAGSGRVHAAGLDLGVRIVELLEDAERQLGS